MTVRAKYTILIADGVKLYRESLAKNTVIELDLIVSPLI
jgi:hypothetical protein